MSECQKKEQVDNKKQWEKGLQDWESNQREMFMGNKSKGSTVQPARSSPDSALNNYRKREASRFH